MNQNKNESSASSSVRRGIYTALIAVAVFLLYAYATDVTEINLEEPQDPKRQAVTTRVIRSLARPDFLKYEEENPHAGYNDPDALF